MLWSLHKTIGRIWVTRFACLIIKRVGKKTSDWLIMCNILHKCYMPLLYRPQTARKPSYFSSNLSSRSHQTRFSLVQRLNCSKFSWSAEQTLKEGRKEEGGRRKEERNRARLAICFCAKLPNIIENGYKQVSRQPKLGLVFTLHVTPHFMLQMHAIIRTSFRWAGSFVLVTERELSKTSLILATNSNNVDRTLNCACYHDIVICSMAMLMVTAEEAKFRSSSNCLDDLWIHNSWLLASVSTLDLARSELEFLMQTKQAMAVVKITSNDQLIG